MSADVEDILGRLNQLKINFDALLRYWAIYQAATNSTAVNQLLTSNDPGANGVIVIRTGMARLVVLNLRRALEPVGGDRWSMLAILDLLAPSSAVATLSDPMVASKSGFGSLERRVTALEECRHRIIANSESDDAAWIRRLRHEDIAHSRTQSSLWDQRSAGDLNTFVLSVADDAFRLCDTIIGAPQATDTYAMAYREAEAFWALVGGRNDINS